MGESQSLIHQVNDSYLSGLEADAVAELGLNPLIHQVNGFLQRTF